MPSKLKELYERYQQRGEFPSRLQIKMDMEELLKKEEFESKADCLYGPGKCRPTIERCTKDDKCPRLELKP